MTKMAAWEFFLQNGGVSESLIHKMAAWEFCLQDGGVSESLTHQMAARQFSLQYGGACDSFAHKMAAWEIFLHDGGNAAFLGVLPTRWRRGRFAYKMAASLRVNPQDGGV